MRHRPRRATVGKTTQEVCDEIARRLRVVVREHPAHRRGDRGGARAGGRSGSRHGGRAPSSARGRGSSRGRCSHPHPWALQQALAGGSRGPGGRGGAGTRCRGWIDSLPNGVRGPRVAAFDTRANKPVLLVGSAARGISRRLRERGYLPAAKPQSFFVQGTPGPLEEGELERAADWGRTLGNEVLSPTA